MQLGFLGAVSITVRVANCAAVPLQPAGMYQHFEFAAVRCPTMNFQRIGTDACQKQHLIAHAHPLGKITVLRLD